MEPAYGVAAMDNPEGRRPTMRGFKIAYSRIGRQLRAARERLAALLTRRRGLAPRPHYARSDEEGRTLWQEIFQAAADIEVTDTELRITICPFSSPHRTLAVQT